MNEYQNNSTPWVFLSSTRKVSLVITLVIISLVFLQTLLGKFGDETLLAWAYVMILALPLLLLFWLDKIKHKFSGKIVSNKIHRLTIFSTISYFFILLGSVLAEPFFNKTTFEYRINSFFVIFPLELVLLLYYRTLFFGQRFQLSPSQELIANYIKLVPSENDSNQSFKKSCYDLVATNELEKVLALLRVKYEHDSNIHKSIIMLQRRLMEVSTYTKTGVLKIEDSYIWINRIAFAILEVLDE